MKTRRDFLRDLGCLSVLPILPSLRGARDLTAASSQALLVGSPLVNRPYSVAMWVYLKSLATVCWPWSQSNNSNTGEFIQIFDEGSGQGTVRARSTDNITPQNAVATAKLPVGQWAHVCAIFESDTSRSIGLNGAIDTNTGTCAVTGSNTSEIGRWGAIGAYSNMLVAFPAVYSVALTAPEVLSLSKGVSPLRIRPQGLREFWPGQPNAAGTADIGLRGVSNAVYVNAPPFADNPRFYF